MMHGRWMYTLTFVLLLPACGPGRAGTGRPEPQCVEQAVMQVVFFDAASAEARLGKDIRISQGVTGKPLACYYNQNRKEMLCFEQAPENQLHAFHKAYVGIVDKAIFPYPVLDTADTFITGKGIRVGMTQHEVTALLGSPDETNEEDMGQGDRQTLLRYHAAEKAAGSRAYSAEYRFWNNRLRQFSFGFE